jgi:hypothetical protein
MNAERDALGLIGGKPLPIEVRDRVLNAQVEIFIGEALAKRDAVKPKKAPQIHEKAELIYQAYPRHIAKDDALKAITTALKKHEFEYLLDKTTQFGEAVKSWPSSYRYMKDGRDTCPYPASWFNAGRFMDEPHEWRRHGARTGAPHQKVTSIEEPDGWRKEFPEYVNKDKPWASLPESDQRFISETLKTANVLAHPLKQLDAEMQLRHA